MYRILATDVFDWSKVICECNELFIEKGLSIDHSEQVHESIDQHNKEMQEAVIFTLETNTHTIDLQKKEIHIS